MCSKRKHSIPFKAQLSPALTLPTPLERWSRVVGRANTLSIPQLSVIAKDARLSGYFVPELLLAALRADVTINVFMNILPQVLETAYPSSELEAMYSIRRYIYDNSNTWDTSTLSKKLDSVFSIPVAQCEDPYALDDQSPLLKWYYTVDLLSKFPASEYEDYEDKVTGLIYRLFSEGYRPIHVYLESMREGVTYELLDFIAKWLLFVESPHTDDLKTILKFQEDLDAHDVVDRQSFEFALEVRANIKQALRKDNIKISL